MGKDGTMEEQAPGALHGFLPRHVVAGPDAALVELAGPVHPGRAVDLGAGEGRNSLWLAAQGWDVVAVDLSKESVARVDERAEVRGVHVECVAADMEEYLEDGKTFDLVVIANIHPAPADRRRVLSAAASAVAPRGHLFFVGHHRDSFGAAGPPDAERLYTEEIVREAFSELDDLLVERLDRPLGDVPYPVVDVVAWASRGGKAGDGEH